MLSNQDNIENDRKILNEIVTIINNQLKGNPGAVNAVSVGAIKVIISLKLSNIRNEKTKSSLSKSIELLDNLLQDKENITYQEIASTLKQVVDDISLIIKSYNIRNPSNNLPPSDLPPELPSDVPEVDSKMPRYYQQTEHLKYNDIISALKTDNLNEDEKNVIQQYSQKYQANHQVDKKSLASLLYHSSNENKKSRKIYRDIANSYKNQISDVIEIARSATTSLIDEKSQVIMNPHQHNTIKKNIDTLSERNDSAGMLMRKHVYFQDNELFNKSNDNDRLSGLNKKYQYIKTHAENIALKNSQIEALSKIEAGLIQEKANNDALDSLRKKPAWINQILVSPREEEFEKAIKNHTREYNPKIKASLKEIDTERKKLQKEVKAEEKIAILISRDLVKARREMIESLTKSDRRGMTSAPDKMSFLIDNIKCELEEKKDRLNMHINSGNKKYQGDNYYTNLQKEIDETTNELNKIKNPEGTSTTREKLKQLDKLISESKLFTKPGFSDLKNASQEHLSRMKHELNRLDDEYESRHEDIRKTKLQIVRASDITETSTLNTHPVIASIDNAIQHNESIINNLKNRKDITDNPDKNMDRINKYNKSIEYLDNLKNDVETIMKKPDDLNNRDKIINMRKISKANNLPESTKKFFGSMAKEFATFVANERMNKQNQTLNNALNPESSNNRPTFK